MACPNAAATDGGVVGPQTCVNASPDGKAGTCLPGCDPFSMTNTCPTTSPACHIEENNGNGFCDTVNMGAMTGSTCSQFYEDCPSNEGCNPTTKKCENYCSNTHACTKAGATCTAFTMGVGLDKAGVCTDSP
jgi:hypothetical protein